MPTEKEFTAFEPETQPELFAKVTNEQDHKDLKYIHGLCWTPAQGYAERRRLEVAIISAYRTGRASAFKEEMRGI